MIERTLAPPIMIVTGPRDSGRTTFAVMVCAEHFKHGLHLFHNGTACIGLNREEYANTKHGLQQLAEEVLDGSIVLIEEADVCNATRKIDDPTHAAGITSALRTFAEKGCALILTTVPGNERLIAAPLIDNAHEHVTPFMDASVRMAPSLMTTHRFGQYLVPADPIYHDPRALINAMMLSDAFRDTRSGVPESKGVTYTEDRFFEVRQTSVDQMKHPKHPEYPVLYRSRIVRRLRDGSIHRLTQNSILFFTWLESINEHRNETIALELFERTMLQWGFDYRAIQTVQDTNFPDGQAFINGEHTNIEVVSIQPRFRGGHSLHDLVGLTEPGRAAKPEDTPILRCQTCRMSEPINIPSLQEIPEHDESHCWVIYTPRSLIGPDFPEDLTVIPELTITHEGFTQELESALQNKSQKIARQGMGKRNWVLVVAQGFPVEPDWYSMLSGQWPDNIDGICVVATENYLGAFNDFVPYKDLVVMLLKCPADTQAHNCYHPGYRFRVSSIDANLHPLSKDEHTIQDVSDSMLNFPWPARPIKRSLTLRDEHGDEIAAFWGASFTKEQVSEILDDHGYCWVERHSFESRLWPRNASAQAKCWAWVRHVKGDKWIGSVVYAGDQLPQETFDSDEDAKGWCEAYVAAALMHLEDDC